MMNTKSFTTIAALAIIGAGGFIAGRISSPGTSEVSRDAPIETKSSRASSRNAAESAAGTTGKSDGRKLAARSIPGSPEERLSRLESIVLGENPLDRSSALLAWIDQLGPGDFEQAVASFRRMGITESRMGEYALLLSAWAKADPLAALEYATQNTGGRFASNTILTTWASSDPEAALRWAETHHQGEGANPHLAGIIRSLGATDPARATQVLTGMPRSRERGEALDAFLPHLLRQGGEAARGWIESLTDDALRNGAMMRVADKLAAIDPSGTAAWLLKNPSEATQRRMDDVYSAWAQKDEQAALTSLAALPAGENRSNALRGVVTSIAVNNPSAAVSMMDRFPNDVNDRVVQQFVWHSFGSDPAVAVNQIARIADEGQRNRMYGRALEVWLERDPSAATAWMKSNPLPTPVQERLNRQRTR